MLSQFNIGFSQSIPSYVPKNGLVGWWPFNGNANDESGHSNNGTVNGATLTTDRFGNLNSAYSFNGISNDIQIPYSASYVNTNMTISYWKKSGTWRQDTDLEYGNRTEVSWMTGFDYNNPNRLGMQTICNGNGIKGNSINATLDSNWNYLTFVVTGNLMKIYKNGKSIGTANYGTTINCNNILYKLYIGHDFYSQSEFYKYVIDDLGIYNRALTDEEILTLFNENCVISNFNPLQDTTKACGVSSTFNAGSGFTSYSWSTGATSQTIAPTTSGKYKITVTNASGCTASDSTYLSIVNANILQNDTAICKGSTVSLSCQTAKVSSTVAINNYSLYHQAGGYYADPINDDYVTFPVSSTLNANYTAWTMECWAKIISPQEEGILSIGNPEHLGGNVIKSNWTPTLWAYGNTNSGLSVTNKVINYSTAAWNHYALSYNNGTYRLFLNGILQESWNSGNNVFINNVYPLMTNTHWWWRGGDVQSHRMTVFYDDIRVSKSCRYSSNFIPTNNWQNDINTLGLWNFNEGSGKIAYDLSGNNNNGIITGATYKTDVPPVNTTEFDSNSYLWTTGDTTETIKVTPTKTTTYYCTVSNGISSCVDSITVTVNDIGSFNPLQDTTKVCGATTTLNAGSGYATYSWNIGATTQTIAPTSSGKYKVTVTNTSGCTASDSIYLSIVNANILQNDTAICKGNSIKLSIDSLFTGLNNQNALPGSLQNGLVAYYPFNGNANDESGNSNNGKVNSGVTITTDRFGIPNSAYDFNGGTIEIPSKSYLSISQTGAFSVSLWIMKTGSQNPVHIIGKRASGAQTFNWQIAQHTSPAGKPGGGLVFTGVINSTSTGVDYTGKSDSALQLNQWELLVGTYNNGKWTLYKNGLLIAQKDQSVYASDAGTPPLEIGNCGNWGAFFGKIDDVSIYNRALTQTDVQRLYS